MMGGQMAVFCAGKHKGSAGKLKTGCAGAAKHDAPADRQESPGIAHTPPREGYRQTKAGTTDRGQQGTKIACRLP